MENSYLQNLDLSRSTKDKYPLPLLKLMTRHAEDLIWVNDITKAEAVLNFIVNLTERRTDASELRKGKTIYYTSVALFCQKDSQYLNQHLYKKLADYNIFTHAIPAPCIS